MAEYRTRFRQLNGEEASKPILCVFVGVHHDPAEAQRMRDVYLQRYCRSTVEHYEFDNVGFADIEGYEYYAGLAKNIQKHGLEKFNGYLADLQVWGTPQQVVAKLLEYVERCDAGGVLATLSFGGMPPDQAAANVATIRQMIAQSNTWRDIERQGSQKKKPQAKPKPQASL